MFVFLYKFDENGFLIADVTNYQKYELLYNHIIVNSQNLYMPDKGLSLDESMISYMGRNKMKVFIPLKPIRVGFKAFILTEFKRGYVYNWSLYEGKDSTSDRKIPIKIKQLC